LRRPKNAWENNDVCSKFICYLSVSSPISRRVDVPRWDCEYITNCGFTQPLTTYQLVQAPYHREFSSTFSRDSFIHRRRHYRHDDVSPTFGGSTRNSMLLFARLPVRVSCESSGGKWSIRLPAGSWRQVGARRPPTEKPLMLLSGGR
jgi:hypothetical protein